MSRRFGVVTVAATCFALSGAVSLPSANNSSCGGCTAFVRQATLDWWWPWSITHTAGIIYTTNQSYYLATAAPMDSEAAVSALLTPYEYTYISQTIPESSTYTVVTSPLYHPSPVAAATSFVTISSAKSVPTRGSIPSDWGKYFYQKVGNPTIAVTGPAKTDDIIISRPTGYVYYTEYEVESRSQITGKDGSLSCSVGTSTYQLSAPAGFSYGDNVTFTESTVQDALPTEFAPSMNDASCTVSSFAAEATVFAVITAGYNKRWSFKIAHPESSALSLEMPSITPPPTKPTKKPTKKPGSGFGLAIGTSKGGHSSGGNGKPHNTRTGSPDVSRPVAASSTKKATPNKNGGTQNNPGPKASDLEVPTSTKKGQVMAPQVSKDPFKPGNQQSSPSNDAHHPGHPIKKPHTLGLQAGTSKPRVSKPGADSTSPPNVDAPPPIITVGGHTYTPNAATQYSIAGKTLTPGGTVTVSGTAVALNKQGNSLVQASDIEGVTPKGAMTTPPPALLIGPSSVTAEPSQGPKGPTYIVSGQTLTPGGAVTVGESTYSLPATPTVLVVNGMTQFLPLPLPTRVPATLSYDGKIYTAQSQGGDANGPVFVINGQTLTAGGDITISNTQLSLAPDASTLLVEGTMQSLKPTPSGQGPTTKPPVLTVGGTTYQANGGTTYTIKGQTLTPGQEITVSGTTIRLLPSATAVVVNGKTTALFPATGVPKSTSVKTTTTSGGSESSSTSGGSHPTSSSSSTPALAAPTVRAGNVWSFAGLVGVLAFA